MTKLVFNREIRLGDLLNIAGFLIAAAGAWMAMDSRVTRQEERSLAQADSIKEIRANVREISQDVKDTQRMILDPPRRRSM